MEAKVTCPYLLHLGPRVPIQVQLAVGRISPRLDLDVLDDRGGIGTRIGETDGHRGSHGFPTFNGRLSLAHGLDGLS